MRCPKCGNEQAGNVACTACGIFFAKYQAAQERNAAPARAVTKPGAGAQGPVGQRKWLPATLAAAGILAATGLMWDRNAGRPVESAAAPARQNAEELETYGPVGAPRTTKAVSATTTAGQAGDYGDPLLQGADARVLSAYHNIRQRADWQPEQGVSDAELAHVQVRAFEHPELSNPSNDQLDQTIAATEHDLEVVRGQMKQIVEGPIKQTKYFTPRYGDRASIEDALEGRLAVLMDKKRVVSPTEEMIAQDKQAALMAESQRRNREWNMQQNQQNQASRAERTNRDNTYGHSHCPWGDC